MPPAPRAISELLHGETRFGRLTVVGEGERERVGSRVNRTIIMRCDCGGTSTVRYTSLLSGATTSCGCYASDVSRQKIAIGRETNRKHSEASRKAPTSVYRTWTDMKYRCTNPQSPKFADYGGRGIGVCERWLSSYEAFRDDMEPKPSPAHSLDRIENDQGYEPGNCRWATATEQANNRRERSK